MELVAYFHGRYLGAVDAKGRVSLPADLRAVIARRAQASAAAGAYVNDRDLLIAPHRTLPCLRGVDPGFLSVLHAQALESVAHLTGQERLDAAELAQADLFGDLEKTSFDDPGRMSLPATARRLAGIDRQVLFVGASEAFQMWDPQAYLACDKVSDKAKTLARAMIEARS